MIISWILPNSRNHEKMRAYHDWQNQVERDKQKANRSSRNDKQYDAGTGVAAKAAYLAQVSFFVPLKHF